MTQVTHNIIEQIISIPYGKVVSYGDIAKRAGLSNGARQVVRVLHMMTEKYNLPWHRVIRSDGKIALQGDDRDLQIAILYAEGVKVSVTGRVNKEFFMKWESF